MLLLNIGCGSTFHPDWINIDVAPFSPNVRPWNLQCGLPYGDNEVDVCYTSHVLEHLSQQDVKRLIRECFRILKPNGIVRAVVPDLEAIAKTYITCLEQVEQGNPEAIANYDWIMLELYDQSVRIKTGGEMGDYLSNPNLVNSEFIRSRLGFEFDQVIEKIQARAKKTWLQKVTDKNFIALLKVMRIELAKIFVSWILGKRGRQALSEGLFRQSGEIHCWMYDRFSLRRLFEDAGFSSVKVYSAFESSIPNFSLYQLDTVNNKVRKPDSLFIESIKS
jgi:predicted SAM-dependent methyltransferase